MPRKKELQPEPPPEDVQPCFHVSVGVIEDGRVEARLQDDPDHPVREIIGRTTVPEAAKFIFHDLYPEMVTLIEDGK